MGKHKSTNTVGGTTLCTKQCPKELALLAGFGDLPFLGSLHTGQKVSRINEF